MKEVYKFQISSFSNNKQIKCLRVLTKNPRVVQIKAETISLFPLLQHTLVVNLLLLLLTLTYKKK